MKQKDGIIIGGVILAAVICFLMAQALFTRGRGSEVVIYKAGEEYGRYSLEIEKTIRIGTSNSLLIKGGVADMTEADCPDQLCVKQKPINQLEETIICLPNKIIITVEGGKAADIPDAIVH